MSNTRIHYLYRDASNYKYGHEVVVQGVVTYEQIKPYLNECGFAPADVDLPHPGEISNAPGFPNEDDHPFCEIEPDDFEIVDAEPTVKTTAEELLEVFKEAHVGGWPSQYKNV